ncbi:Hsp70 family protein [Streptomyces sp. NPDC002054]|uniref:Hsp70 family protein n=1 Tax=Streptomyces sp. NPDC002054 TaxID=3154663 RepID=UPI003331DAFD
MKQHIIAAIDFGTHGSGYGWTTVEDRHRDPKKRAVHFRTRWQGLSTTYPKNLTALLIDRKGELVAWGYEARSKWVTKVARGEAEGFEYHNGFKMSLAAAKSDGTEEIEGGRLTPERSRHLVTLYLREVYSAAVAEIELSGFSHEEIRWCLTVPAIWNDYQKQLMREAAVAAGLPDDEQRLQLVIEPEAAAYHARVSGVRTVRASGGRNNLMNKGSRFLVADCGGGTIDITAYRTDDRNRLEEIGRECGGKYGSEYVNQAFLERVLAKRLGSFEALDRVRAEAPAALLQVLGDWEKEKAHVETASTDDIYLQLPAAIDRLLTKEEYVSLGDQQGGITDHIVVTADEARDIFESVLPDVLALVDKQLAEMKAQRRGAAGKELIILVGGFGSSTYLQERMQEHVADRAVVLVPPEPHVAVLLGAVHYTYDPQTKARRARYTYGCQTAMEFRPGIDPEEKKLVVPDGRVRCNDRYSVFVSAGQSVPVDDEVARSFSPLYENQKSLVFDLYTSPEKSPRYVTDSGCTKVGTVEVDLSEVMDLPLARRSVTLSMMFGEVQIRVVARVKATGRTTAAHVRFSAAG